MVYPLPEVLLCVLCATMAGADDFVEIERWATKKLDFLRRFLPFEDGVASHDTLNLPPCRRIVSRLLISRARPMDDRDIVASDGSHAPRL